MSTRNSVAKKHWAEHVYHINSVITCLYSDLVNQCIFVNYNLLTLRVRKLVKTFYSHCLDHVTLAKYKLLSAHGNYLCFENCWLSTLSLFLEQFPVFPSRHEWRQSSDILELLWCLRSSCPCAVCSPNRILSTFTKEQRSN